MTQLRKRNEYFFELIKKEKDIFNNLRERRGDWREGQRGRDEENLQENRAWRPGGAQPQDPEMVT